MSGAGMTGVLDDIDARPGVLDDIDARPGSAVSLLRTVVGLYLRRLGGWMPVAALVLVLQHLGLEPAGARTAISRVKAAGLLVPQIRGDVKGYALAPGAVPMLEAGDRRIFHPRRMSRGDGWCLISFSLPEERRAVRHQLRRRTLQCLVRVPFGPGCQLQHPESRRFHRRQHRLRDGRAAEPRAGSQGTVVLSERALRKQAATGVDGVLRRHDHGARPQG